MTCLLLQVMAERDTLGTQLIRRNDELALVYEKLRIQQTTLSKGESQYRERIEDIRLLKLEIKRLRRERQMLSKSTSSVDDLRRELFQVQRELLRERTRCKALEEEVQTPLNVHRWRRLEGSDPNAYEMIQKVQTLQKRLIAKTEEVVEKELHIQEMEKQYLELKGVLSRQVVEALRACRLCLTSVALCCAAGSRGGRAAADLPASCQGQEQAAQGDGI